MCDLVHVTGSVMFKQVHSSVLSQLLLTHEAVMVISKLLFYLVSCFK